MILPASGNSGMVKFMSNVDGKADVSCGESMTGDRVEFPVKRMPVTDDVSGGLPELSDILNVSL